MTTMTEGDYLQIDGKVVVSMTDGVYSFSWFGGDMIGVTRELLDNAVIEALRIDEHDQDVIIIGPYRAQIVKRFNDTVIARRIYDEETGTT